MFAIVLPTENILKARNTWCLLMMIAKNLFWTQVANLCVMKDEDRLNLLKEVAGTTVYEERRSESIRIMQETSNKQEQIMVSQTVELEYLDISKGAIPY